MFKIIILKLILLVVVLNVPPVKADGQVHKALQLATEAKQRDSGWNDMRSKVVMTLTDSSGRQRVRELLIKSKEIPHDGDKSLFVFKMPRDIKGSAFLSFSHIKEADEQWLYLPALARIKRIASANKSGSFMGSEFAYEDLSSFEVDKYKYHYIGHELCSGGICHLLEQIPTYKNSGYQRRVVWQDDSHSRIWKIDYYDHNNKLLKTLKCDEFSQYLGKYWRPKVLSMENHQTGKSTTLAYEEYQLDIGLRDTDFHKNALRRAH
jgi:outer membrane lipoprotein-sorting protein